MRVRVGDMVRIAGRSGVVAKMECNAFASIDGERF